MLPARFGSIPHCLLVMAGGLLASPPAESRADDPARLAAAIRPLVAAHQGRVAVAVKHLESGTLFVHREHEPHATASLIKVPVMVAAYEAARRGAIRLDDRVTVKGTDKVPGSGILTTHFADGLSLTLRDAIRLMIAFSDNTATNLVIEAIGRPRTTELFTTLGYKETRLNGLVFRPDSSLAPDRSSRFGLGSTTAHEQLRLFEALYRKQLVDATACTEMLAHLAECDDRDRLTRFLPEGVKASLKTGSVGGVRTVAGIVHASGGPFVVVVLTEENKDRRWSERNAAQLLSAEIARAAYEVFDHAATRSPAAPTTGELVVGTTGELVEALQRTLNVRLSPSPKLSVDGEFGPSTRQAVQKFQGSKQLKETGIVDRATWEALGSLVEETETTQTPEQVNTEVLTREAADDPTAPPPVTARAWAIGDAQTGKLMAGGNETERRDFASTTKTMTACLVAELAREKPGVLEETVVFSRRADETPGSTAGLRAGERIPVREALYGLMLPSGNDAATALAEHFGGRFEPPADAPFTSDPLERFVAEMNRRAARLEMTDTRYANPHGLTDDTHKSTARDQLKLAVNALSFPLLREVVGTRQRGCRVEGPGGWRRDVVWKNTNRLLEKEGYAGLKTGTTDAAGACLVSLGAREGRELIVVVLGSANSDARYFDTRHLFRWAWQAKPGADGK